MTRARISDIVEAMQFQSDEISAYLHRPTGKIVTVDSQAFHIAEEDGESDWLPPEAVQEAREIAAGNKDYLALPGKFEIDDYAIMKAFSSNRENSDERDQLLSAIRGAGAFRYFKDTIHRLGVADEWYAFKDKAYEEIARDWCEEHQITLED